MSIVVRGVFRARSGRVEAFRSVALALQRAAADEPGTVRYTWYADDEPSSFVVIEEYVDAAAAHAHNKHCAALLDQAGELAEMTAVDLHGDPDPALAAWVADRPQARAHPPLHPDGEPAVLHGRETAAGLRNFPVVGRTLADLPVFLRHYARVKAVAARVNHRLGVIDEVRRDGIVAACAEILDGRHADRFPTPLVHGGGGTTTNMNLNEVIAARASVLCGAVVHALDHVNASQSTNDTYPTAMALAVRELVDLPVAALRELAEAFERKAVEFADTRHLGRTCLQDAVSLSAGDTHHAHATAVRRVADGLERAAGALAAVPIGATAVGTGIGAPDGFAAGVVAELAALVDRPVTPAVDRVDALAHLDPYAAVSGAGSRAAMTMSTIAADLRLWSSGPRGGFADLTLPALQAGSTIMPAKVNPVVPEYVVQLGHRVRGHALTVDCAVADGELELNVMEPVILDALASIVDDLTAAARTFARLCVTGLRWDGLRREENLAAALDPWVQLSTARGHDEAAHARRGGADPR